VGRLEDPLGLRLLRALNGRRERAVGIVALAAQSWPPGTAISAAGTAGP
jgi:hypothetical protein